MDKIEYDTLVEIMDQIKEYEFPKSKQVEVFIALVKEHFEESRGGA